MVVSYNKKINKDGSYRNFYGWTVISMLENRERLQFIINFIKDDNILAQYFSPLPTSSYHVTVSSIWNTGSPLLKHQENFLEKNYSPEEKTRLTYDAGGVEFFNPKYCINSLLETLDKNISHFGKQQMIVDKLYFTGQTLGIKFKSNRFPERMTKCRDTIRKICKIEHEPVPYHLTLAYIYKQIPDSLLPYINGFIVYVNKILNGKIFTVEKPIVAYFSDMTEFIPYKMALHCRSHYTSTLD